MFSFDIKKGQERLRSRDLDWKTKGKKQKKQQKITFYWFFIL